MWLSAQPTTIGSKKSSSIGAIVLVICLTIYFGSYPYDNLGDRGNYVEAFVNERAHKDFLWGLYSYICHFFMDATVWLYLTALLYCLGFYLYARDKHPNSAIVMMLGFLGFLFFKAYAVNTMRAGIAVSVLVYSLTWRDKNKWVYWSLLLTAIGFHFSLALTAAALLFSQYRPRAKYYFNFWLLCIPLSLLSGPLFQVLFAPLVSEYHSGAEGYLFSNSTHYDSYFRIDFIIYSLIPLLIGYHYIFRRNIKDSFYLNIFNAYLIANGLWILVIRASFSDRIAFLSWLFIPILLLYPLLKYKVSANQNRLIAATLSIQALFSFALSLR